jgi:integrase
MAIIRAPLKTDRSGKCSRWRVILYNPATHKQEWHTVRGSEAAAKAFQREQETRVTKGTYIAKAERRTFAEVAEMFMAERAARNRRSGTVTGYRSVLKRYLVPEFGPHEVGTIRRQDIAEHFTRMREEGATVQTVNRALRTLKAVLFFALERELIERNVCSRFRPFEGGKDEPHVRRGAFSEEELRALLAAPAEPRARLLVKLLVLTGLRPGEAYALEWGDLDLEAGCLHVRRSWDGKRFNAPKTRAGERTVPLDGRLVEDLRTEQRTGDGTGLVFGTRSGKALSASNVRRDIWLPLLAKAGLPYRDLYSLRATFATLARASGEAAFNVSRTMGHSRSLLVDQVYARTLQSGLASVATAVASRVLGEQPKLRVIEGGARDVRESLDGATPTGSKNVASA